MRLMEDGRFGIPEYVMVAALLVLCCVGIYGYATLPPTVPTHFGFSGAANEYGSKATLLLLPAIGIAAWFLIRWSVRNPQTLNLPFEIPDDRVDAVRALDAAMSRTLGAETLVSLAIVETFVVSSAATATLSLAFLWAIGAILVTLLGTVVAFTITIWRAATR